ncbi:MAG: SusC/RagA family TonB-linked outer membrane protein [Bacteroidaceae bacterium]|nr:SusC/RagA family TonB-linked outer membrane protein [Bacteroidaceae bacterium]
MKKILSILLLMACFCLQASAQVKAGDVVSGQIWDDLEPLMMCNVVEVDNNNRIVAHGVTDINGNFSFKIVNPKDKIRISYIGCQTVTLPITKRAFGKIVLKSNTTLQEVTVKAVRKTQSSGLQIPVTEISVASQTIDMKEFEGLGMTSVDEALQGRIAGLDIVANSGNLGAGTTMRLRGVSTINGNADPLVVVNGNVWTNDANAEFDYTNANEEKFAELLNVNPEDIESITVLKDAAATAIWGSQGANGVIEIKTKRGSKGKTKVQYSYRFTGSWQPEGYKLLNGDDYTMFLKESFFNPKMQQGFGDSNHDNYIPEINYDENFSEWRMYDDNTNWRKEIKSFGQNHQHFVSLTGGGEKANFRISGGYDHQTGTVIQQRLDRFTTRVALDYFVSDRIKVSTNFDLTYTKNKKNYRYDYDGDNNPDDLMLAALLKMPNLSVYAEDDNGNDTGRYYTMNPYLTKATGGYNVPSGASGHLNYLEDQYKMPNPVAVAHQAKNDEKTVKLSPEFILQYDLLGTEPDQHRLRYEGQIIFDIYTLNNDTYFPGSLLASNWSSAAYNSASTSSYKSHALSTRHTFTFTPHFNNESHSLMFMARFQYNNGSSSRQNLAEKWLPTAAGITSPLAGGVNTDFGTEAGEWRSQFFLFSLHYAYKGKYIVDATLRRDGSTKFGPDRRWGNFPGLSARWNISDEPFMEKVKWISMLSIRPGWGIVGRQPDNEYLYYSKYSTGGSYLGETSVVPSNIRLADLRWEQKETWNLGFDFGFFNGLIDGDLSLYTQKTTDLLMRNRAIPSSSGFTVLSWQNVGSMRNNGWEFNINGHRVVKAGKFSMDFNVTFANNRNEIISMDETVLATMNGTGNTPENGSYLSRVQLNNPLGSIYGYRFKGVYRYSDYSDAVDAKNAGIITQEELDAPNIAPVVRNAAGEVVYNPSGTPKYMYFDYDTYTTAHQFVGGDAIYEDVNHDGHINALDVVYLGSSLPRLTGGFGMKFNYGAWSLNLQFNYRYGNKVINYARMNLENMATTYNQSRAVNWRWHNEGDVALLPRAVTRKTNYDTYNYLGSDRFVENASFLRLNYAQLSYTFEPKALKQVGLSSLRFNLTLNNLFCITKYSGADPEIAQAGFSPAGDYSRTPRPKSFTIGASVSF